MIAQILEVYCGFEALTFYSGALRQCLPPELHVNPRCEGRAQKVRASHRASKLDNGTETSALREKRPFLKAIF